MLTVNGLNASDEGVAISTLILVGASGSGKSAVGHRVAEESGWQLFDTDAEILRLTGLDRISQIFDRDGETTFRHLEADCITRLETSGATKTVVATGGGLPAIPGMMERLNRLGSTVYLKAPCDELWKRLNMDPSALQNRPLLRDDGRDKLEELLSSRSEVYLQSTITLNTGSLSVSEVCKMLLAHISPPLGSSYFPLK